MRTRGEPGERCAEIRAATSGLLYLARNVSAPELAEDEVVALAERGWFVRDGFLGAEVAKQAHAFCLQKLDEMRPAGIGQNGVRDTTVRSDLTTWLDDSPMHPAFEQLRLALNLSAYQGLRAFQVQLACYPGGGAHYDRHRDAFPGHDIRRITAIVYLNPDWQPEHGGQLRLHTEPLVDVEPRLDRLVCFLSEKVDHEVMPSFAQRFAATSWFRAR